VILLKAIVLNLLSVAAAYDVLVAVFQYGWGERTLGFRSNGGIAIWLPIFHVRGSEVRILPRIMESSRKREPCSVV
jgi:hypothetical protein